MDQELIRRLKNREARIAVVGLGHVGLVTAVMFAKSGFEVVGVDIKPEAVNAVSSGKSHAKEPGFVELIREVVGSGNLKATLDTRRAFEDSEVAILCVQTPVTDAKQPDLSYLTKACEDLSRSLHRGKFVVVESSVPPGTTRRVAEILEKGSGLKCGEDFWLAHCPERVYVGNALQDFEKNVRIVGGYERNSTLVAVELFKAVTTGEVLPTDSTTAEIVKLAENSFRDVNIAFANELALICENLGVDVVDVVKLANTHPRVNIHKPGCGVGGPCLPKDPYLLVHSVKDSRLGSRLILSSRELNGYMPLHAVDLVVDALKKAGKDVKNSKIAVLGAAYRGEIDDARNSSAERIVEQLTKLRARVVVYDPYTTESFGARGAPDLKSAVEDTDCIVTATDHRVFRKLELKTMKALMRENPVIIDGRRIIDPRRAKKLGFLYAGVGHRI